MINKTLPFLITLIPTICFGLDDACTKPKEFTIDKRCYVTEDQKTTYPYNTVVALIGASEKPYCTGTIIKGKDNSPKVIYTAKHCTDNNDDKLADETITIKTQDGATYKATNKDILPTEAYGNYNIAKDNLYSGDWAKYELVDAPYDLPFTTFTSRHGGFIGRIEATREISSSSEYFVPIIKAYKFFVDNTYNAQVVGYGSLKIMSDKEIRDFKDKYTKFLETSLGVTVRELFNGDLSDKEIREKIEKYKDPGFRDGGIYASNAIVKEFIYGSHKNALSRNDKKTFRDRNLKISFCKLDTDGYQQGCQNWGGNSGGPIFDKNGKLMGIATRGNYIIGGARHANRDFNNSDNDDLDSDGRPDSNIHFLK